MTNFLKTFTDYQQLRRELKFRLNDETAFKDEASREEYIQALKQLMREKTYLHLAFDRLLNIAPDEAIDYLMAAYLDSSNDLSNHPKDQVREVDLLLESLVASQGKSTLIDLLSRQDIGLNNLKHRRVVMTLEDLLSAEELENVLKAASRPSYELTKETVQQQLEKLLNGELSREAFVEWCNIINADYRNGLVEFKDSIFQKSFLKLIPMLSNFHLKQDADFLYAKEDIREILENNF